MQITLRQIRYFVATAESGKISQAAIELYVSQSAITIAIQGLEELLGIKLFERRANGMFLTLEGGQFLQRAKQILIAVEEAMHLPNQTNIAMEGTIKLAVSFTVAGYFLPTYLSRFTRNFPNIELQLIEASRDKIEEGIINGTYDIAIMLTPNIMNQEDILIEGLIRSNRQLWLSSDHRFSNRSSLSLQDISRHPYIMLTVDEASNTALRYWNQTPYRPNIIFKTESVEAVRSLVADGMGVTILSDMVYRPWSLEGRRLEVLPISDFVPTMDIGLAWAKNREISPAAHAFQQFMKSVVSTGASHSSR